MDKRTGQIKPEQIIEIIFRRRWFVIIPFCLSMIVGLYLAIMLPKVYEASTLILVEKQRVPEDYVQSIVSTDIDARINTISQQILSRTNIEKIITELGLFSKPEHEKIYMEDKVKSVRTRINVEVTQSRRQGTESFTVSFKGKDPEKVKQVVNTLATFFIDENLKFRENQAVGTSHFLEGELLSMREKLEVVEEKMKDYRKLYMGELPEQLESNLRILDRIQEQLTDTRNRKALLEQQLATAAGSESSSSSQTASGRATSLQGLKNELANLSTKYTENHPDILRLKKQIAKKRKQQSFIKENEQLSTYPSSESTGEVRNLENEIFELKRQAAIYKKRVENTPKHEQELMTLNRDYQNIQQSYSSLLSRKLEADISVNMEQKQKGERFRVIDSAKLPRHPVAPDMGRLFIFVLAAGFGIGGGLIFLLEYLDTSFRRVEDVESCLKIPVLATIPNVRHPEIVIREKVHKVCTGFSIGIALILFTAFTVATFVGPENTVGLLGAIING